MYKHVLSSKFSCTEISNSMDNLSSYCGLVDANIRASDKDLPVLNRFYLVYLGPPYRDDIVFRRPLSNLTLRIEVGKNVPTKNEWGSVYSYAVVLSWL